MDSTRNLQTPNELFGTGSVPKNSNNKPFMYKSWIETVIDGRTGILFKEQNTEAILEAIKRFNETKFDCSELRENAEKYHTNTIKTGNEILSVDQSNGIVGCAYKNIETGEEFKTSSRYLLACDGANSTIRKLNNIELKSLDDENDRIKDEIESKKEMKNIVIKRLTEFKSADKASKIKFATCGINQNDAKIYLKKNGFTILYTLPGIISTFP